jgi:hypothetical protein
LIVIATEKTADVSLTCRRCGACGLTTKWETAEDGKRRVRADCASCGRFVRHLDKFLLERAVLAVNHPARKPTPESWEWTGLVRATDGEWQPVALAATLPRCWDLLLTHPSGGDRLAVPTRPVRIGADEGE